MKDDLEHYKQLARAANSQADYFAVGRIIAKHLVPLFGDDHDAAHRFYRELERESPSVMYEPMRYE